MEASAGGSGWNAAVVHPLSMASPPKLRYHRTLRRSGSRDDTGPGAVCNDFTAESGAARRSARAAAGRRGSLLLLVAFAVPSPGARAGADPFSATVKVDATADTAAKARETARARRPAPRPCRDRRALAGRRRPAQIAEARRQGDHRPRRQFRGRQRADVGGALCRRLHLPFPPGRDPPRLAPAGNERHRDPGRHQVPASRRKPPATAGHCVAGIPGRRAQRAVGRPKPVARGMGRRPAAGAACI